MSTRRVLFVFLDGVGLGPANEHNPLSLQRYPGLERLSGGQALMSEAVPVITDRHLFQPADANLDLEGLPQSGTGQASLFTGINCAHIAERHYGPYPHSTSRPVIDEHSVFQQLINHGLDPGADLDFANAYPRRFFSYVETTNRWTVTTLAAKSAGLRLHSDDDLRRGDAVAANLTAANWPGDSDIQPVSEPEAADHLAAIAARKRLTLFEYYLTDKAGHMRPGASAEEILASLNSFFDRLITQLPDDVLLLVTSDHGNLEDLSSKSHTRYAVPLAAIGPRAAHFAAARSILDVTPLIVSYLTG